MAGVMTVGDEGMEVKKATVPTIDGEVEEAPGLHKAYVVESAHLTDAQQQDGVQYPETPGMAVTNQAYPTGTDVGEGSNPLRA